MALDVAAIDIDTAPYGALLLRLCFATMFTAHAMLKWRVFTIPVEAVFFESLGLPGWLVPVTIAVELSGAGCLLLGIVARWVALLLIPLILGTIVTVNRKNGWLFSNPSRGLRQRDVAGDCQNIRVIRRGDRPRIGDDTVVPFPE